MSTPKRHPLSLAVAVALGLGSSQLVSAAEFTVTNSDDSGTGSLRWAVDQANNSGDASNNIVFDSGVTGTITLNSDIFVSTNSLAIQGPGPDVLTVEQDGRVLLLGSSAASVVISGLTLRHTTGSTTTEPPLFNHSPSLSIDNVHFRGESASVGGYGGGCLSSSQWTSSPGGVRELNISNSAFDNCRTGISYPGGSVYAEQTSSYGGDLSITIENTTMHNGFAGNAAAAYIRQSTFDGSSETSHGVTINGLEVTDHDNYGGYGTLFVWQDRDSSLDIDNLDMSGNSGRGAFTYFTGSNSTASIRRANFLDNNTGFEPIVNMRVTGAEVDVEVVDSQFSGPLVGARSGLQLSMFGGGQRNVSIRDSLFHENQFQNNVITANLDNVGYGGDTLEIVNTTISNNEFGINVLGVSPIGSMVDTELRHVTITDNTLMGGPTPVSETPDPQGQTSGQGMVSFLTDGERRVTNSIIHGVSVDGPPQPTGTARGLSVFDLTGDGEVTVDHSLVGLVDPNVTATDAGGSFIDDGTDPALLPLSDNGGQSQTRAFAIDSPVFDAANPGAAALPAFDQRGDGFARISGNAPDMGAFELQVAPAVGLSVETLNFPDTRVQTTSAPLSVEVTNTGSFELNISQVATSLAARGVSIFAADGSGCTTAPIAPGESCSIEVTFTPGSRDAFTGSLDITTDADPAIYSVGLNGTGVAPILEAGPNRDFGAVVVGTTSAAQTVTLDNSGDDTLEVTGFNPAVGAPFSLDFSDCGAGLPFTVPAGGACDLSVAFAPAATGNFNATVDVASDSLNPDASQFTLTGQGVVGQLSVSPSGGIDFGEVDLGESGDAELTLTNEGSAPVTVDDWTNLPEPFSISGDCPQPPFVLQPGESCTLVITFSPESAGDYGENLILGFDDGSGAGSIEVAVSGRGAGQEPALPATPIPTLDRIGLVIGSGLLALMGLFGLRRRQRHSPLD